MNTTGPKGYEEGLGEPGRLSPFTDGVTATPAPKLPDVIELIAQQWDGCKWDEPGGAFDIGDAIRAAGNRLMRERALGVGEAGRGLSRKGLHDPARVEERLAWVATQREATPPPSAEQPRSHIEGVNLPPIGPRPAPPPTPRTSGVGVLDDAQRLEARKTASDALDACVREYLEGYELRGDGGDHTPTEFEAALIADALAGLIGEDEFIRCLHAWDSLRTRPAGVLAVRRYCADGTCGVLGTFEGGGGQGKEGGN